MTEGRSADVIVVGAGPAGAVAAALLAREGVRVALIDRAESTRPVVGEVLPPAARLTFERLGIGGVLDDPAHRRSPGTVSAWGSEDPREVDFVFSPYGEGLHLDRVRFDAQLRDVAAAAGADVLRGTWNTRADSASGGDARPRVILDCTGRMAAVARSRGATIHRLDTLVAVAGVLTPGSCTADADSRTLVASVAGGWWYSVLLPDGRRVAAFHTDVDLLPLGLGRDPRAWHARLIEVPAIGSIVRSSGAQPPGELRVLAADSRTLRPSGAVGSGRADVLVIAAGDAGMAFDPLSSQGILSAIQSAEEAVALAVACLAEDRDEVAAAQARRADADRKRWARYEDRLALAYGDEQRWHASPFWARRHARRMESLRGYP